MQVFGHLGVGILAASGARAVREREPELVTALFPATFGAIAPDLLDKAILAVHASVYGRTIGHSLLFFGCVLLFWAVLRRSKAHGIGEVVGFFGLGIATHLVGDLADDSLRGLIHGGNTLSSFFAWPFATPYAWVIRNPHPLGIWPWSITPLEVAVLGATALWLALLARRARMARTDGDVSAEARSSLSPRRLGSFATFQLKRRDPGGGAGQGS